MSVEITSIKREIVETISFDYFQVANGWTLPKYRDRRKAKRIDRNVYVWKLRKYKVIHIARTEKPFDKPVRRQGIALLSDILAFQEIGLQNANWISRSIFVALTPKMIEHLVSSRKKSYLSGKRARAESRCKNPFDMLKSGRAKLYFWDSFRLSTLGGKILVSK